MAHVVGVPHLGAHVNKCTFLIDFVKIKKKVERERKARQWKNPENESFYTHYLKGTQHPKFSELTETSSSGSPAESPPAA